MKHWTNQYIGVPYSNMNCGEFAICIQREVFKKKYFRAPEHPKVENPFHYNIILEKNLINYLEKKIEKPVEGCCVLMKTMKRLTHVGVYTKIGRKDYVIHCLDSFKSSILHKIKDLTTYGIDVEGYYSWK